MDIWVTSYSTDTRYILNRTYTMCFERKSHIKNGIWDKGACANTVNIISHHLLTCFIVGWLIKNSTWCQTACGQLHPAKKDQKVTKKTSRPTLLGRLECKGVRMKWQVCARFAFKKLRKNLLADRQELSVTCRQFLKNLTSYETFQPPMACLCGLQKYAMDGANVSRGWWEYW